MKIKFIKQTAVSLLAVSALAASSASMANSFARSQGRINTVIGADNNSKENLFIQPQDPALSGGDRD